MRRLKQGWAALSTEAKLSIVVMPIVLAFLVGLVIPFIADQLSSETKAKRSGVVKVIDVEEGVPLGDFAAQHASTPQPRFVLAMATDDVRAMNAQETTPGGDGTYGGDAGGTDDGAEDTTTDDGTDGGDDTTTDDGTDGGDDTTTDDTDGGDETTTDDSTDGGVNDADGDGVADADDLCPTTKGNLANGCLVAYLRTESYGCTDMAESLESGEDGSQRCKDLGSVAGQTTGGGSGDVQERANAIAAALHETQTVAGEDGRLEPLGVTVTVQFTVTGFAGEHADLTWSLRHGGGARLPHEWLRNRSVLELTGEAESDSGSAEFWVPLPKRPRGPYFVRIGMYDDEGTPLTFAKTSKIG